MISLNGNDANISRFLPSIRPSIVNDTVGRGKSLFGGAVYIQEDNNINIS
jgi:hypothetical protein